VSYRIAMVCACPFPVPQGSQVLLKTTAQILQRRGHEVCLVVYGYGLGEDDSGVTLRRCLRVPFARRTAAGPSLGKPLLDLALLSTLRRVVGEERIDIVHAHNYEGLLVALGAAHRPIVYHAHNAMADELPHYLGRRPKAADAGRWLDRQVPRRADAVIAPHAALGDYLVASGCLAAKVHVIPPSVDVTAFAPPEVGEALPPVLYTGNLDGYQNLGLLRAAMDRVRAALPEARLVAATADRRDLPGAEKVFTADYAAVRDVLGRDSVVAMPRVSWSGYPMKLLNAMAAGRAIVACRSAAHPLRDGKTGLVVPDDDVEAFAAALLRLLQDPALRLRLGTAAREAAATNHDPDRIAERIEAVYGRLGQDGKSRVENGS